MQICIFDVESWEREAFDALKDEHSLRFSEEPLTAKNARRYSEAEGISVFIYSSIDSEVLDAIPGLKIIASRSTGVDQIDLDACKDRGITVCNVPTYGTHTVAEHVFGLLLMISHKLEDAVQKTRRGDFTAKGLQGFDLHGKTLGVFGTGDIGRAVIRIAKGFEMDVLAFDVKPDEEKALEMGFVYADMDTVLKSADVITLHVPSTPKTHHLIGRNQFEKMKEGAVLINTSRGNIVDIQALARALADGKIAAAGLDVLPSEPVIREEAELLRSVYEQRHDLSTLLADQVLVRMKNVIVTPHSAFFTREAVQRILDTTVENIQAFAQGTPINTVGYKFSSF